jgi:charged multivesicular body protein 2A
VFNIHQKLLLSESNSVFERISMNMTCLLPQLKLPQIQKIMMDFEKESEIMDMKEEMMSDAIDDAMGEEGDEEER